MTVPSLRAYAPLTRFMARLPHSGQGRTSGPLTSRRLPLVDDIKTFAFGRDRIARTEGFRDSRSIEDSLIDKFQGEVIYTHLVFCFFSKKHLSSYDQPFNTCEEIHGCFKPLLSGLNPPASHDKEERLIVFRGISMTLGGCV